MSISDNRRNSAPFHSFQAQPQHTKPRERSASLYDMNYDQQYIYVSSPVRQGHTVAYGRTSGLSSEQVRTVMAHYDAEIYISDGVHDYEPADIRKRMTQHYRAAEVYFQAAVQSQRKLTEHESSAQKSGDAEGRSVCHIIANVTVQCMLNHMTMQNIVGGDTVNNAMAAFRKAQDRFAISEHKLLAAIRESDADDRVTATDMLAREPENALDAETPELAARWASFKEKHVKLHKAAAPVITGLAQQAAAVARMRGIGRAIIQEEPTAAGYGENNNLSGSEEAKKIQKRTIMAGDIARAFGNTPTIASLTKRHNAYKNSHHRDGRSMDDTEISGCDAQNRKRANSTPSQKKREIALDIHVDKQERLLAYISFMRNIADTVGNLRLGSAIGNGLVGAGFDMPLTHDLQPTEQGSHLLQALFTYGLPELEVVAKSTDGGSPYTTGIFSTDKDGNRLSSSRQIDSVPPFSLDG